jgi:hypothetical protein
VRMVWWKRVLLPVIAGIFIYLGLMFSLRSHPTIRIGGTVDSPPLVVLVNPFHDRAPERTVSLWLAPGLSGHWNQMHAASMPLEAANTICGGTGKLRGWNLKDRRDASNESRMLYNLQCDTGKRSFLFHAVKIDAGWKVEKFVWADESWDGRLR